MLYPDPADLAARPNLTAWRKPTPGTPLQQVHATTHPQPGGPTQAGRRPR